jgi:hypothetical protein
VAGPICFSTASPVDRSPRHGNTVVVLCGTGAGTNWNRDQPGYLAGSSALLKVVSQREAMPESRLRTTTVNSGSSVFWSALTSS